MIEIEKTYLAKYLPDLSNCEKKEMLDIYIPTKDSLHARIRVRKQGPNYEITKKTQVNDDHSQLLEETIHLNKDEFEQFESGVKGKRVHKNRYYYTFDNRVAEIDVFLDELKGLVVVEFEFNDVSEMKSFKIPDFCLVDVSQEDFIAGGMLCGKNYSDLEKELDSFKYKKLFLK